MFSWRVLFIDIIITMIENGDLWIILLTSWLTTFDIRIQRCNFVNIDSSFKREVWNCEIITNTASAFVNICTILFSAGHYVAAFVWQQQMAPFCKHWTWPANAPYEVNKLTYINASISLPKLYICLEKWECIDIAFEGLFLCSLIPCRRLKRVELAVDIKFGYHTAFLPGAYLKLNKFIFNTGVIHLRTLLFFNKATRLFWEYFRWAKSKNDTYIIGCSKFIAPK